MAQQPLGLGLFSRSLLYIQQSFVPHPVLGTLRSSKVPALRSPWPRTEMPCVRVWVGVKGGPPNPELPKGHVAKHQSPVLLGGRQGPSQ